MGTEKATTTVSSGKTPALYHVRARQRSASNVLGLDSPSCPSTPPLRSRITVPFLWEDAPGKPKPREAAAGALFFPLAAAASSLPDDGGATTRAGGDRECGAVARPAPLKLPPRLQAAARPEHFSSPKTVLQGPYVRGGGEKPPRPVRRSGSMVSCRMMPGTGGGAFSWRKGTSASASACGKKDGHDHDASCCSPAASSSASSSSSSSSSMSYFFDVHSRGSGHWQQDDGREDPEDGDVGAKGSVRITRFRRNKSLPNISTSHLWASIRKGVKQISPWS